MSVNSAMTSIADKIRALLGVSGKMGLNAMASNLSAAQDEVDDQSGLLDQAIAALQGKAAGGGSAELNTGSCTVVVKPAGNTNHYVYRETVNSSDAIEYKLSRSYTSSNISLSARCDSIFVVMASNIKSATATGGEILEVVSGQGVVFRTPSEDRASVQVTLGS